jgi:DNA-directed RNA polymerase specialized sigma24 family protein
MPGPPPEDRELLKRIAAGDDAAFSACYRTHLDAVIAFFRRRVTDAEPAFDLAAETFAAVVAGAASYAVVLPAGTGPVDLREVTADGATLRVLTLRG